MEHWEKRMESLERRVESLEDALRGVSDGLDRLREWAGRANGEMDEQDAMLAVMAEAVEEVAGDVADLELCRRR